MVKSNEYGDFFESSVISQSYTNGTVDEPVVQIAVAGVVMIADIVELPVNVKEVASEVVGQRHSTIETEARTTVKRLAAQVFDLHVCIVPLIILIIADFVVHEFQERGVFHHFRYVGFIGVGLKLVHDSQHRHRHDVDEQSFARYPVVCIAHAQATLP